MKEAVRTVRKYLILSQLYTAVCIVAVPFAVSRTAEPVGVQEEQSAVYAEADTGYRYSDDYTVGGQALDEYIKGVVAAEMPASFPAEALKAQAVASRTYAVRAIDNAESQLAPEDIGQAYITVEKMKENWGDAFEANYAKICSAVDSTAGEIIEYGGEPILAVFHSTSAGTTETAGNIWSYDLPYLESTDSEGDMYAPNYETVKTLENGEIISMIKAKYPDFDCDADGLFDSVSIDERSEAGYITSMKVGNMTFTGKQIREALGLRSSNFTAAKTDGGIAFTTKGYGHGAGMSQYGAKYMAENGSDYIEILEHYYKDITIGNI
ncbi:MAG: stage II sporulation protein D [Clostridia bacterium]|nr:stage II sporulation protein D [Clostridia bacterium]